MKTIFIKSPALTDIIAENKTYELRLKKKYFQNLKIGDICTFKDSMRKVICIIEDVLIFKTFEDVFEKLDFKHFNTRTDCKEDTINLYKSLYPNHNLSVLVLKIKKKT